MSPERVARRPASLALRLTVSIGLVIGVVFLALGWVIERSIEHHFAQQDAEELEAVAHSVQQALNGSRAGSSNDDISHSLASAVSGHHGIYYYVADRTGTTLYVTPGPRLDMIARTLPVATHVALGNLHVWQELGQSYRGAVLEFPAAAAGLGPFRVVLATATGFHQHFLAEFRQTSWIAMALAALIAILSTWQAVYRGHAPLRDISARIRGISVDRLHLRLDPAQVPIELAELAATFNATLERIERDFHRLSNFSADIAHELRTPVTNLVTQTQVLLTKTRSTDAYREVLYSNLEEYDRMARMIGDMLYLAQTDNQLIKPAVVAVDLGKEVDALFEYFEPLAEERQVQLTRIGEVSAARGDRLMLRRALTNLLSNAIRHTPDGQAITVSLQQDDQGTAIEVANRGDAIPPEHLDHLFERFYRVDRSRQRNSDGAGLGLAIAKSIVEAHGGTIAARSCDGINSFEIRLPRRLT